MPGTIPLEIVTPTRVLYTGDVEMFRAPGTLGSFQVFPRHLPFMTTLEIGQIDIRLPDGTQRAIATSGGFVEVLRRGITVLAETAEFAEDIDAERAERARQRAFERLQAHEEDTDRTRAELALARAMNRLKVAKRGH